MASARLVAARRGEGQTAHVSNDNAGDIAGIAFKQLGLDDLLAQIDIVLLPLPRPGPSSGDQLPRPSVTRAGLASLSLSRR
jgi:hypothetical protein